MRWTREDLPARRLLDAIGVPHLDYYSAADERQVKEALRTWPLLSAVSRLFDRTDLPDERPAAPERRS